MRIGSLFSGYGGLDMGVQSVLGGTVAWHVEFAEAPSKILAHHWPDVPNYGDISAVDWASVEPVDILTGGFPCQDVSLAGRRAGLTGGTRSGLWSEYARAIDVLRPKLVVIENVRGLLSAEAAGAVEPDPWGLGDGATRPTLNAFGVVLGDLAGLGYDARWIGLRAADAGAPHGRFRVFVIAEPSVQHPGHRTRSTKHGNEFNENDGARESGTRTASDHSDDSGRCVAADAHGDGRTRERRVDSAKRDAHRRDRADVAWGAFEPAIRRWESTSGRLAPSPTEATARNGAQRLSVAFVEWMMGLETGHVTDVPGLTRNDQLKALGNGVVPQQAALALSYLMRVA